MGKVIDITFMVKKLDNPPNRIREQRKARGMTLQQVADKIGSTPTVIGRFETGQRPITLHVLQQIARAMGTDVGQLLNPEDNPASLDDRESGVIDAMRSGDPHVAEAVARVAESLASFVGEGERRRA